MNTIVSTFAILEEICKFQRPGISKDFNARCKTPFWRKGYLYATDGAIIAREPCSQEDAWIACGKAATRTKMPPAMLWPSRNEIARRKDVSIVTPRYESLMKCNCPQLNRCGRCVDGLLPIYRAVKILGCDPTLHFGGWYLAILARHGVTKLKIAPGRDGLSSAAVFEGDGFEGMLMPFETGEQA